MIKGFDVFNINTWNYAKNIPFVFENECILNFDTKSPATEIEIVNILKLTFEIIKQTKKDIDSQKVIISVITRLRNQLSQEKFDEYNSLKMKKGKRKIELADRNKKSKGHCWKCGSEISTAEPINECNACGFITYLKEGKEYDEYQYWGNINQPNTSIYDKFDYFLINNFELGFNFEKKLDEYKKEGKSQYFSYDAIFNFIIRRENCRSFINYSKLASIYYNYSRFLFETNNYFFEALDCYHKAEIQNIYENCNFNLDEVVEYKCMKWCSEIKNIQTTYKLRDILQRNPFPIRSCTNTEYYDYEDIDGIIEQKIPVGFCTASISSIYNSERV